MHIPDGYLSPATCATLYAAAMPFWYVSLQRARRVLRTGMVPLISLFAAFCFVVMMFNLPLPGGTTGHAVGVAIAAIVLGPWNAILAVSVALFVQAVFFGDGGLTSFGANCFNMAIVGSLVGYATYRIAAGSSDATSRRRVFAAGIAGYVAINAAALLAALEFGIQPMLFHDATGTPLYAPYRLGIAVPAVMIGHLTLAGAAELILSGGVIAFIQRTSPELLARRVTQTTYSAPAARPALRQTKHLWAGFALLLLLTPLGVLAVGTAWGEWSARDFSNPDTRQQITDSSRGQVPPAEAPTGLQRLSSVWTAPFPGYGPSFVRHRGVGYMLSGMFGAGLIILVVAASMRLASPRTKATEHHEPKQLRQS
jgi:cobalt/nickel transport system permease protein